jgi:FkbM family methyltransferase
MHRISQKDINELHKFNLKNSPTNFVKSLIHPEREKYHIAWINGNKLLLRRGKTDILVFKKIFIDREYDFKLTGSVNNIIDAGANIGLSAIFFSIKYPMAKIIAIEPEHSNFILMQTNVSPYPNIIPVLGGISNQSGKFAIKNTSGDHWNFMLENCTTESGDGSFYTIHELMDKYELDHIDFLKIDIEGGEEMLFKDNTNWLKKTKALSIELHDFIIPKSSNSFFSAITQNTPFSFYSYGENHLIVFN